MAYLVPGFYLLSSLFLLTSINILSQTATISGDATVCLNSAYPEVTFTGSSGTPPYTFTYTINSGPEQIISTTNSSVIVTAPTTTAGTFIYTLTGVSDASLITIPQTGQVTITVNPLPTVEALAGGASSVCVGSLTPAFTDATPGGVWSVTPGTGTASITANGVVTGLTAGDVTVVYTVTSLGCSNAAIQTLTVNPLPTVEALAGGASSVCVGSLTPAFTDATPGGVWSVTPGTGTASITTSGVVTGLTAGDVAVVYTVTSLGCSNAAIQTLTINPLPTVEALAGGASSVCVGSLTPAFTDATPGGVWSVTPGTGTASITTNGVVTGLTAGDVTVVYTVTSLGCSNAAIQTLTINPLPTVGALAGGASSVCVGSLTPAFTDATPGGVWSVTPGTGTASITTNGVVTGLTAGDVTVVYTVTSLGCSNAAIQTLTINPLPTVGALAGGASSVCVGSLTPAFTDATPGGVWSVTPGTGTASITTNGVVTGLTAGDVTVVYTVTSLGCSNAAIQTLTVNPLPTVGALAGGASSVCVGSLTPAYTDATPGGVWSVTPGTGTASITTSGVVTGLTAGDVTVVYTVTSLGCSNAAIQTLTINPLPTVGALAGGASSVCVGSLTPAFTDATPGGVWSVTPGTGTASITTSGVVTGLTAGDVTVVYTVTSLGCSNAAIQTLTINPLPTVGALAGGASSVCVGSLTPAFTDATPGGVWSVTPGTGTASITTNGVVTGLTAGDVTVVYTVTAGGCSNAAIQTLTVNPLPVPGLLSSDPDNTFCSGTDVTFTASGGIGFDFQINGLSVQSGSSNAYITNSLTNGQVVKVIVTNANGCSATSPGITNIVNPLPFIFISAPPVCSTDLSTYSLSLTVSSGNVTSTSGSVTNTSNNVWTVSNVAAGTDITVTVTNSNGCASSLGITAPNCLCPFVPAPVSGGDKEYCASGVIPTLSVSIQPGQTADWYTADLGGTLLKASSTTFTPTAAGTYYAQARNVASGCVSNTMTPVTLTVNPLPQAILLSSDADNSFCIGTSVTFTASGGVYYNFRVEGLNINSGISPTYTTNRLSDGQMVDVIVTDSKGCKDTSAAIINKVNPYPVSNAGSGGSTCSTEFNLSAVPSIGAGTWSVVSGPGTASFAPDNNTPDATVTVSEYGAYTFRWKEVSLNCADSSQVVVIFNELPVANAGPGGNNCGLKYFFQAVPSVGRGTWTQTSGPGTSTFSPGTFDPFAAVTVSEFGQYTFTWTEVNGTCSNASSVTIDFIQIPSANAGNGGTACGLDFNLHAIPASDGGTGTWTLLTGPGSATFSPDSTSPDVKVTVDSSGTYRFSWTEVSSTCQSTDAIDVIFHESPTISAGKDTSICANVPIQLEATGVGKYHWEPAALLDNPELQNPIASPDTTTVFKLTLTDVFGCVSTDEIKVTVSEPAISYAGPDQVLNYIFTTNMEAAAPGSGEIGDWSVVSGSGQFADVSNPGTLVNGLSEGVNVLVWTVSNGICPPSDDTVNIEVSNLVIPTLITPNRDGKNDFFILRGLETLGKSELIIFDRRGVQVYKNSDYDNSWDGVDFNGTPLPDDTYFYVLKAENGKSVSGYIVIRR